MRPVKMILVGAFFALVILIGSKANASECENESIPIINLIEGRTEPKVEQLRSAALTYLLPIVIFLAIPATYSDYLRGRMDLKSLCLRCALVFFLLYTYTGNGIFPDVIK